MPTPNNGTAAAALLKERDKVEAATAVIDRDPEKASAMLAPIIAAAPNVGEITQSDMFNLMSQMQAQMAGMQAQILQLMTGDRPNQKNQANTAAELAQDKLQRDLTLKSWNEEPREPVWLPPDQDEEKIHSVTGKYPPRLMRINGLEFPITPGEIAHVPSSVARLVEYVQRKKPMSGPPQGLPQFADPDRGQFLASSQSITIGNAGKSGEGRLIPDSPPLSPQPLGIKYDHNGQ